MDPYRIGFVWDQFNSEVQSVFVRDVLTLKESSAQGMVIVLSEDGLADCQHILDSLTNNDSSLTVDTKMGTLSSAALLWVRYIVEKKVMPGLLRDQVVDRDFRVEVSDEGTLTENYVIPTHPYNTDGYPSRTTNDPQLYPMPNPRVRPYFMYSSVTVALNEAIILQEKL